MPGDDVLRLGFPRWVGVVCADLEGQLRFYRDVLGMPVTAEGDGWIQFDLGEGPTFELVQRSTEPEYDRARYQVGFTVPDIEAARRELIARGVAPVTDILGTPEGARWAYFRDPEGNVFEITERPGSG
jgi:catechol 2,3-dioxygenase-like lactoylglutathione lyase family enzyme